MKLKMTKILALIILTIVVAGTALAAAIYLKHKDDKNNQVMQNKEKFTLKALKNLSITVVYDNNPYKQGLKTAWGFSCIIKGTEKTILFDTGGDGSILLANMQELDINPEEIDLVVLSHIHNDHVGGLTDFLEINPGVTIYLPASFPENFKRNISKCGAKTIDVREPVEIGKGVYSTGELGTHIIEQSLIIVTEKGIILITGCAHPGIVKIINKAKDLFNKDVLFATGGFHLARERGSEISNIITDVKELGVHYIGPCHCSGDLARNLFRKEFGNNYIEVGVGRVINLDELE
jgi:7,8-dihydropterin-6-yl-methyl-4-(beta-D-ribofuranosyl)aminobenzene 5'-phosphate synthase